MFFAKTIVCSEIVFQVANFKVANMCESLKNSMFLSQAYLETTYSVTFVTQAVTVL